MAKRQKINLSASRDVPFNELMVSQSNMRQVKAGVSIKEPPDDIARDAAQLHHRATRAGRERCRDPGVYYPRHRATVPRAGANRQTEAYEHDRAGALHRA